MFHSQINKISKEFSAFTVGDIAHTDTELDEYWDTVGLFFSTKSGDDSGSFNYYKGVPIIVIYPKVILSEMDE